MPDLLYDRQQALQLTTPNAITIAGLGGIGSWVAILAAMSGVPNVFLFDPDTLEEHNRNRLPFCQGSLNQNKVDIVANYIKGIRPECNAQSASSCCITSARKLVYHLSGLAMMALI
jgi:tRNA A37 threonylcarbamoyladenosine dehydratase